MWPVLLDMTEEESIQGLRHLELEAYSSLVSALRAQGHLSQDKRKLLKETSSVLNIPNDRHKAEVRRAISDERLNTIAYHITGQLVSSEDWAQEGRRLVPLLPRVPPQTPYSIVADDASDDALQYNKQLPLPANTERKRPAVPQSVTPTVVAEPAGKSQTFRIPDAPKDDSKKKKGLLCTENSTLAQHLLGSKLSRIQQIYRQSSKSPKQRPKEFNNTLELDDQDIIKANLGNFPQPKVQQINMPSNSNGHKINIIQNISIPISNEAPVIINDSPTKDLANISLSVNENQAPKTRTLNIKPNLVSIKQSTGNPGDTYTEPEKSPKLCATKKTINKGQKLIVVSNTQTLPTNSILQKTLSVPINKLTKLNLEKFKIVSNNQLPSTIQVTSVMNSHNVTLSKHKVVTLKSNPGKKVIPLSQLQMLNPKGSLKVVPYSGKIFEKNLTNTQLDNSAKMAVMPLSCNRVQEVTQTTNCITEVVQSEAVKSESNDLEVEDAHVKNVGNSFEDFEIKIEETFQVKAEVENKGTVEESNNQTRSICDADNLSPTFMEIDSDDFMKSEVKDELLEEFEVLESKNVLI